MNEKHLHIVSFIVPYPVNYGGVFDIYHKIVALHKAGIKIHLHCFTEDARQAPELEPYCQEICYYPRHKGIAGMSLRLPYIVSSRMDRRLWTKLERDNFPVLLEGIHSAGWLYNHAPANRKIILRLHNVERDYYKQLFLSTRSTFKKIYFHAESVLLDRFERVVARKPTIVLAVSQKDVDTYRTQFNVTNIALLPVFTGFSDDTPPSGAGKFCLYHGNLSVPENEKAVSWLLTEIFYDMHMPLIIAGKKPSPALTQFIAQYENVKLVADPSKEEIQKLLSRAQCNVLPSFNTTGVKLKIINALFHSRHCIVNNGAVNGSGLESICHIAKSKQQFRQLVLELSSRALTSEEVNERKKVLNDLYDDDKNCNKLIQLIW